MKTTARSLLSAVTGLGLATFMLISAFTFGANAPATVIAFSLLVIYGLLEIAILSYSTPRFVTRRVATRRSPTLVGLPGYSRVPALAENPERANARRAA
jgi:hypothetical protein